MSQAVKKARGGSKTRAETTTTTTSQTVTERQELETRTLRTPTAIEVGSASSEISLGFSGSPLTRQQEKEEFKILNTRLANYIDKIRSQEQEIVQLRKIVQTKTDTTEQQIKGVKEAYEQEVANLRKALDDTSKDLAEAVTNADNYQASFREQFAKAQQLEGQQKSLQKRAKDAEVALKDAKAQLNALKDELKDNEEQLNTANARIRELERQLETLRKELQDETVGRVDAQNRLMSANEELKFQKGLHEDQMNTLRSQRVVEITEVETRLEKEYQSKIADQLEQLREELEDLAIQTRMELEQSYARQTEDLQNLADRNANDLRLAMEELRTTQNRMKEAQTRSDRIISENRGLISRLEGDLRSKDDDIQRLQQLLVERQDELQKLHNELTEQLRTYQDLLDVKIQLDAELATYHALLKTEEDRLKINAPPFPSTPDTQRRGTKRRHDMVTRTRFRNEATATGDIHIVEIDSEGQFVRLENKSAQDVVVGGWTLNMKSDQTPDSETRYKIHPNTTIKSHATMTIWSANTNVVHDPPTDIVMEGRWLVGDNTSVSLANSAGDQVARREMSREESTSSASSFSGKAKRVRPLAGGEVNGDDQQKNCIIM